jgi:integrase
MVKNLLAGRTSAVDYDPIEPVADEDVEQILSHLKPMVQDMVKIQRRIGGRSQDMFNMRFCDIDMSGEIWEYVPFTHKSKKRGKKRIIYLGPKSQQILQPYLDKCTDQTEFVFMTSHKNQCSGSFYRDAIRTACRKAGVEYWTPHQL